MASYPVTQDMLEGLTTAHVADACLRLRLVPRCVLLRPLVEGTSLFGKAVPVRHYGSVDVFLEAITTASPGTVLVVDNAGRLDEGCIGDLVSLEAKSAGISGIVIWGCHRDTAEIRNLGLPLFSLGAFAVGPVRLDPRGEDAFESAKVGAHSIDARDFVVADDDGVLFVPSHRLGEIAQEAKQIRDTERAQAAMAHAGRSLRSQFQFKEYLEARALDPALTFREHLQTLGAKIEEDFH